MLSLHEQPKPFFQSTNGSFDDDKKRANIDSRVMSVIKWKQKVLAAPTSPVASFSNFDGSEAAVGKFRLEITARTTLCDDDYGRNGKEKRWRAGTIDFNFISFRCCFFCRREFLITIRKDFICTVFGGECGSGVCRVLSRSTRAENRHQIKA